MAIRRKTRTLYVGKVPIGSDHPIVVQSMCNTDTRNVESSLRQIDDLAFAGCQLVRLAVVDQEAAEALKPIAKRSIIPVIADIHFDYRLALTALESGVDGLRINPGNIGSRSRVEQVVTAARDRQVPIRIGVNGGSLSKSILEKHGGLCAEAMVDSALENIRILEELNYPWMKVSLKSSNVPMMIKAYEQLGILVDYPFHIGVTEAGTEKSGLIKSSVGIGILLEKGLGDTLRVSLTADPVKEVYTGYEILKVLGLSERGATLISCPTCGRTEINLIQLAKRVEELVEKIDVPIKVAVMGCPVNGPGEAREADIGIAGGLKQGLIFRKGKIIAKVKEEDLYDEFVIELNKTIQEYKENNHASK